MNRDLTTRFMGEVKKETKEGLKRKWSKLNGLIFFKLVGRKTKVLRKLIAEQWKINIYGSFLI